MSLAKIKQLVDLYYETFSHDHHKDRDCHFYLKCEICSYTDKPVWSFEHFGYINEIKPDGYSKDYNTAAAAIADLEFLLVKWIREDCQHQIKQGTNADYQGPAGPAGTLKKLQELENEA